MNIEILNNRWIFLAEIPPFFDAIIYTHFSVAHPRRRFIDTQQYGWDGHIHRYDAKNNKLALPFLPDLKELCKAHDIAYDIVDKRGPCEPVAIELIPDLLKGITLENHQMEAIQSCIDNEHGIIAVPTGGGKTEIAAAVVKLYNRPTVIIADQRIIIEQIKEKLELRDVTEIGEDGSKIGLFYGGTTPNGQLIIVGSIQSLMSPPQSLLLKNRDTYYKRLARAKQFQEIVKKAELLIVDEVDRAGGSDQFKKLFQVYYRGRFKFGLSGTPFDKKKPIANLMLREYIGQIIYTCSRRELEAIGRIIRIKSIFIGYGKYDVNNDKVAFDIAERENIIDNPKFHLMVKKIVDHLKQDRILILIDTCVVRELGLTLAEVISGSKFISGDTSTKERNKVIDEFETGKLRCLIASKILKRGTDLAGGVECVITIGGGSLWSNFNQIIGRAVRINKKGSARVFSFMCLSNKYLYSHAREQLKATVSLGYSTIVSINNMTFSGPEFLKKYHR